MGGFTMKLSPESLARASSRHPWRTVGIWVVIFILAGIASKTLLSSALTTEFDFTNNPQAKQAQTLLNKAFPEDKRVTETWVITSDSTTTSDPAFTQRVDGALGKINALGSNIVTAAPTAYPNTSSDPQAKALGPIPSADNRAVLFFVVLTGT